MYVRHSKDKSRPVGVRVEQLRLPHARSNQNLCGDHAGEAMQGLIAEPSPGSDAPVGLKAALGNVGSSVRGPRLVLWSATRRACPLQE
jgi:hypothetical protein